MATLSADFLARMSSGLRVADPLPSDPWPLFKGWYDEEQAAARTPNPNAMVVATIDADGTPSCRVVLCRGVNVADGVVTFFTNYTSRKGAALAANPRASVSFHWDKTDRQVRIEGVVVKSPAAESDAYFASRRWESKVSAWASRQSQPLESRDMLMSRVGEVIDSLKLDPDELMSRGDSVHIPRPPHWGGYRIWARRIEMWIGGPGRLHDRAAWVRTVESQGETVRCGAWSHTRLQP